MGRKESNQTNKNSLHAVDFFMPLMSSTDFFKMNLKKSFMNIIRVSNGLDPDMDRRSVGLTL